MDQEFGYVEHTLAKASINIGVEYFQLPAADADRTYPTAPQIASWQRRFRRRETSLSLVGRVDKSVQICGQRPAFLAAASIHSPIL
jgi:hypothetical protein